VIFEIYKIIFLRKKAWKWCMNWWTESTRPAHGSMRLIKPEPFTRRPMVRIRSTKPVSYDQISHAPRRLDGRGSFFFPWQRYQEQGGGGAMVGARESLNSRYRVPNTMWFLPMSSRWWEEAVLHTYCGGNRRWKAGDGGVVWPTLGDGEWLLRWSSGGKNRMNRLVAFSSCSSMLQFLRAAMNWTHTARDPWRLGSSFTRQNSKGTSHYLLGFMHWIIVRVERNQILSISENQLTIYSICIEGG
jgi:hypothetical protein